ncbi:MAG: amidohydrolase family protein [Flavobacteriales bacterium]|nr:amidohydrolase family protein [Flavobacteriales bacterium]
MSARQYLPLVLLLATAPCTAQVTVPVNGPHATSGTVYALTGATLHPAPGETIGMGLLVVQDDKILYAGSQASGKVPAGAVQVDFSGLHIWPSFVEPWSSAGIPADKDRKPNERGIGNWNGAIRASTDASALYAHDKEANVQLRDLGVGTMLVHRMDGIARGSGAVIALAERSRQLDVLKPFASAHFSFRKGTSPDAYPSSLTGSIALLRQTLYDVEWYAGASGVDLRDSELDAINTQRSGPLFFEASERNDILRAAEIGREFNMNFIVKGKGDEYARALDIKATGMRLIIPLTLPDALDVEDPFAAMEVSLAQLKHWELAPKNAAMLQAAGITFAFTSNGLKDRSAMIASLRRMLAAGLDSTTTMAALTTIPAAMIGMGDRVGTLEVGKLASFQITGEHLFAKDGVLHEHWVAGVRQVLVPDDKQDVRGTYDLNLQSRILRMKVTGETGKPEARVSDPQDDSTSVKSDLRIKGELVTVVFDGTKLGINGPVRLNGIVHRGSRIWDGQGQLPGGNWIAWSAVRQGETPKDRKKKDDDRTLDSLYASATGIPWYPLMAFGRNMLPDSETVILRNATVWTNTDRGIMRNTDVCLHEGKVFAIGERLDKSVLFPRMKINVLSVDATGKHLTCGIIDEHSHIAIARGVNEGGQANSAEVRMGDVVDPDDIDVYRNLAGGVTAAQLLHGSANPVGGQSALIKMRWGLNGEQMKIAGADGFIKFALGENVKQSNWENDRRRYPQTRMGVEQLMSDGFHRARQYGSDWALYEASLPKPSVRKLAKAIAPNKPAPRRDLELDALREILDGKRFITCHSYVQSEISMLMDLADSMGFKVNTFTHILEGYKVADRMKAHGASASTFSDWWGYKFEVENAIPYNAAILWRQGVNTGINSDDAEMSRRLNQEAAKAVKYGGVPEVEAWKLVTLNPASMLHLDHRMGKVEPGVDADIVLWNTNPLSIDAKCEMTFVDGVRRYDLSQDAELRKAVADERERIIALMLAAKKAGAPVRKAEKKERPHWHCETIGEEP